MSVTINVHPNEGKKLLAKSNSCDGGDPFVTFEVSIVGDGSVSVFLRNVEDARALMDAALEAYKNVVSQETEKVVAKAKAEAAKLAPITEADPELERLLNEEEYAEAQYEENYDGLDCQCYLCVKL